MSSLKMFYTPLMLTLVLFALCGIAYPFALTGLGQLLAPEKAAGSLLFLEDTPIGSELTGQAFTDPRFMQGRPSAVGYNTYTPESKASGAYAGLASGSANMAPTNPKLAARVQEDRKAFLAAHPEIDPKAIPTDLLTASGSGLDPHISPVAARVQIPSLARHTGLSVEALEAMVRAHTTPKLVGIFGEDTVHVLKVNMDIAHALKK